MRIAIVLAAVIGVVSVADAKPKKRDPIAFVIVLDRSGSMQGAKLEAAKKAVLASAKTLTGADTFALVTFDSEAQVIVKPKRANDKAIPKEVEHVVSGGGTNIFPALKEAKYLFDDIKLKKKYVLLLSDGEAPSDGLTELVHDLHATGITVSTVAVQGADEALLKTISDEGGGRVYKIGDDLSKISAVFVEETQIALK